MVWELQGEEDGGGNNITITTAAATTPNTPPTPSPAKAAADLMKDISTRCKKLELIRWTLPLQAQLRTEERGWVVLEGEVENLRVRNRILMEMGKGKGEGGMRMCCWVASNTDWFVRHGYSYDSNVNLAERAGYY